MKGFTQILWHMTDARSGSGLSFVHLWHCGLLDKDASTYDTKSDKDANKHDTKFDKEATS
jgi:hypothetical protein